MFSSGYQCALHFETKPILLALFLSPAADFLLDSFFNRNSTFSLCDWHLSVISQWLQFPSWLWNCFLQCPNSGGHWWPPHWQSWWVYLVLPPPPQLLTAIFNTNRCFFLEVQPSSLLAAMLLLSPFYLFLWLTLFSVLCASSSALFHLCPFFHCYLFHSPALVISYHLFSRISPSVISTNSTMFIKFKFSSPQI